MKKDYTFSMQKLAYSLIVVFLLFYLLILGKNILTPLVFAGFFAFMLHPLGSKLEQYIKYRSLSIGLSFIIALAPIFIIIGLFSVQFIEVFENMDSISKKLESGVNFLFSKIQANFGFSRGEAEDMFSENSSNIMQTPLKYLGSTISISSNFLMNVFLCFVYTYLLLLYRSSLKNFYLIQFGEQVKGGAENVLKKVQNIIQKYLYGLLIVILILGVFNSLGLYLIGIEYALFWGFLAAILAIIPYVGTFLGGLLPFIYALASTGSFWQPIAVIALFVFVQIVEGNLITPKVVGSSVKINPLAAILSLLIGASVWGVAGLILSLPLIAIIRVIFLQIDFLKPIGLLLSNEIYDKEEVFEEKFDKERFRIFSFFRKKKTT